MTDRKSSRQRNLVVTVALSLLLAVNACSPEKMVPTHLAQINLAPSRYGEFMARVDSVMKPAGFTRNTAAPGLDELRGRDVLFYVYQIDQSDKRTFLEVTDILNAGTINIRVYSTVFADEQGRKDAIFRLSVVLAEFGATLKTNTVEPIRTKAT